MTHKLFERAHRYRCISPQFRPQWRAKDVEYKMIMDAIAARNPQKTQELIERYIRGTTENVVKFTEHLFESGEIKSDNQPETVAAA